MHACSQSDVFGALVVLWEAIKNARMHAYGTAQLAKYKAIIHTTFVIAPSIHSERCTENSNPFALFLQIQSMSLNSSFQSKISSLLLINRKQRLNCYMID